MTVIQFVLQLVVGVTFGVASVGKLRDPRGFARGLAEYKLIPATASLVAGVLIIIAEALIAFAHVTGWLLSFALPPALLLLVTFGMAVTVNLSRGRDVPCYCFGRDDEPISGRTLARPLLLASCEVFLLSRHSPVRPQQLGLSELGLTLFWAMFLLVATRWILNLDDVTRVLRLR